MMVYFMKEFSYGSCKYSNSQMYEAQYLGPKRFFDDFAGKRRNLYLENRKRIESISTPGFKDNR